ncbi:MAG: RNA pseudouridine synthase [Magnetococcales bacterium]|nr:RNA pseudouridine synthase [Magnetococcales bacterium]
MVAMALSDRVLYRDGWIVVIDKPAGVPVHAGPGGGPNIAAGRHMLRFGWKELPELAHRLDQLTSGCLVLGRHRQALRRLNALFAAGHVEKVYWAIVSGRPSSEQGHLDAPIRPRDSDPTQAPNIPGRRMEIHPDGQSAHTDFRLLGGFGDLSWLELRPRTGRTHQLRLHCAHMRCPVVGDPLYGPRPVAGSGSTHLQLHARSVKIPLHPDQEPIHVVAPPPKHMLPLLMACGYQEVSR